MDAVITALFGLQAATQMGVRAREPPIADARAPRGFHARLVGVLWQGKLYDASAGKGGVRWVGV